MTAGEALVINTGDRGSAGVSSKGALLGRPFGWALARRHSGRASCHSWHTAPYRRRLPFPPTVSAAQMTLIGTFAALSFALIAFGLTGLRAAARVRRAPRVLRRAPRPQAPPVPEAVAGV